MCTPVTIKFPDFPLEKEHEDRMYLAIENQNMFDLEKEQKSDTVTLDIQIVEEYDIELLFVLELYTPLPGWCGCAHA